MDCIRSVLMILVCSIYGHMSLSQGLSSSEGKHDGMRISRGKFVCGSKINVTLGISENDSGVGHAQLSGMTSEQGTIWNYSMGYSSADATWDIEQAGDGFIIVKSNDRDSSSIWYISDTGRVIWEISSMPFLYANIVQVKHDTVWLAGAMTQVEYGITWPEDSILSYPRLQHVGITIALQDSNISTIPLENCYSKQWKVNPVVRLNKYWVFLGQSGMAKVFNNGGKCIELVDIFKGSPSLYENYTEPEISGNRLAYLYYCKKYGPNQKSEQLKLVTTDLDLKNSVMVELSSSDPDVHLLELKSTLDGGLIVFDGVYSIIKYSSFLIFEWEVVLEEISIEHGLGNLLSITSNELGEVCLLFAGLDENGEGRLTVVQLNSEGQVHSIVLLN